MTKIVVGGRRRSRTIVIAAIVAIALVAVVAVAYQMGRSGGSSEAKPAPSGEATPIPSETATTGPDEGAVPIVPPYDEWSVPPARISALPASTEQVEGYEVGFPGTTLGAVAFTVASYEAMTATSDDGLVAAASAYYPEEWTGESVAATAATQVEGMTAILEELGYDADADLSSETFGYVPLSEAGDRVVVARAMAVRATDGVTTKVVYTAIATAVEWNGERWNPVVDNVPNLDVSLGELTEVEPGSTEFNQQGWTALNRENWS